MNKPVRKQGKNPHYCLLVNKSAAEYSSARLDEYVQLLRKKGYYYTVAEPKSALDMARMSEVAAGSRKSHGFYSPAVSRRGKVTSLIACGGDGTVNLIARAASKAGIPFGILPMGRVNNIARSLYGKVFEEKAVESSTRPGTRLIDMGQIGNQIFLGSVAFGLPVEMHQALTASGPPRFSSGWSRLISSCWKNGQLGDLEIKIDSFQFEVNPHLLVVSLLSHTLGVPLNNASDTADGKAETIFDFGCKNSEIGNYFKEIAKGRYVYGGGVRLFRGTSIIVRPVKDKQMYLDGELVDLPVNMIEIKIGHDKVSVFA